MIVEPEIAKEIQGIPLIDDVGEDKVIWLYDRTGQITVNERYLG